MKPIKSAKQALLESSKLKSVWSHETHLTQRILIYCAELLEGMARKRKRPQTKWQRFMSRELKRGATIQQAAERWKRKVKTR